MKYLLTVFFFTFSFTGYVQRINGVVTLQNSGKKPIAGVHITSAGANSVISQDDGKFRLVYGNKNKGDNIVLKAEKAGYETVNHKDLFTRLREDDNDILYIYMCLKGELEVRRMKYYNIQQEYITRQYQEELKNLRLEKKDNWETLKSLDKQRKKALEYARELADRFSSINLDNCSQLYKAAFKAFETGEIMKAISLLKDSDEDLLRAQKEIQDAKKMGSLASVKLKAAKSNRKQAIDCYILKADLHVVQYQFDLAASYYEKAAKADTAEIENQFMAGSFLHKQRQFSRVEPYYQRCMRLSIKKNDQMGVASMLGELASLAHNKNEIIKAKELSEEGLRIINKLIKEGSDIYLPYLATALNNFGLLLTDIHESEKAKKCFDQALTIYHKLIWHDQGPHYNDMIVTLGNLAQLLIETHEIEKSKNINLRILQVIRKLAEEDPDVFLPHLALILHNLGSVLYQNNELVEAKSKNEEALEIYRKLAKKNPEVYLPELAGTLNNLASLMNSINNTSAAESMYEEVLQIYRKLADENPSAYLISVARTLNNLGGLTSLNNEHTAAKIMHEEALQIIRRLIEKEPDPFLPDLAMTLNNLGALLHDNNELIPAQKKCEEHLEIQRGLVVKNPKVFLPDLGMALYNLASVLCDKREFAKAKKMYEESLQIRRQLADKNPDAFLPDLVITLNGFSNLLSVTGEKKAAQKQYEEALQIARKLADENPEAFLPGLAMILNNLGNLSDDGGMESLKMYDESLRIYKTLAEKNALRYNLNVVTLEINIGLLYEKKIQKENDHDLNLKGRELMKDADQRMSVFPAGHPAVIKDRNTITRLLTFFNSFD